MDLFGEKLKEIRAEKKYSLDQMARETKISKKYLEAIENNDFSIFPSETYLVGFLRSYTEYLGLDPEKYVNQYRNYKIQEQPIPINELLDIKKGMHPALKFFIIILIMGGVSVGSIFLYRYFTTPKTDSMSTEIETQEPAEKLVAYYFKNDSDTETDKWLSIKNKIVVPLGDKEFDILILKVAEEVVLASGDREVSLKKGEDVSFDLNTDGLADIKVLYHSIEGSGQDAKVKLRLDRVTAAISSLTEEKLPVPDSASPQAESSALVIFEAAETEAFTVQISFKGNCFFRYLIDDDYNKQDQKFFLKDGNQELPARRKVKIWMSNAGTVRARIMGKEITFGRTGQVASKEIRWALKDSGTYQLEVIDLF